MPKKKVSQVAHQLKMKRVDLGLSQVELAQLANVSRLSVVLVENDSTSGERVLPKLWHVLNHYEEDQEE